VTAPITSRGEPSRAATGARVNLTPAVPLMPPSWLRSGLGYWFGSVGAMLRFEFGRVRAWAGMMVIVQTFMGAGMALMYGFFYPHIGPTQALYIATGAPVLALIPLGFVMLPSTITVERLEGTFDYVWSLPAPRSAQAVAAFALYSLIALPGTVLALVVAAWRYDAHLSLSPILAPSLVVCAMVAITVGYGMALVVSEPMVMNLIANALVFFVLLFSPIVFPASQLPQWLYDVHRVLPFYNMAVVIRAGLTQGVVSDVTTSFVVLAAWAAAGCTATAWAVGRRR
jgi:ABC-2 type transport system permease protein